MPLAAKSNLRMAAIFCGLILLPMSAIWSVEFYVNQDGSPHLYNAYLILEILKGNQAISEFAALNPVLIPNLTGHWLLAFLLFFFSPPAASKIFVTLLFGLTAASVVWLRRQIAGDEDSMTGMLFAVALAFNWMWFLGFYNFILGAIGFALTLGFWWRWRGQFNFWRGIGIFLLLLFVFFSHLISFCVLVGILLFLCFANRRENSKQTFAWTLLAILPILPFLFSFLSVSRSSERLSPSWNYLDSPLALKGWLLQLRAADPFQLLSRKSIPFSELSSNGFGLLSPSLWLVFALVCLALSTFLYLKNEKDRERKSVLLWVTIGLGLILLWIFAPDNFGKSHGGFLRERILILGLICLAPAFRSTNHSVLKRIAQASLIFILIFQTLVVWDYSIRTNRLAKNAFEAKNSIGQNQSWGSIIINRDGCRFKPIPRSNISALLAIGKSGRFWDNYELGYYLFPVISREPEMRKFIYEFRESNTFDFCDQNEQFDKKFAKLKDLLQTNHQRIEVLLIWGSDPMIDSMISEWYQAEPFFESGEIRLFHLREAL